MIIQLRLGERHPGNEHRMGHMRIVHVFARDKLAFRRTRGPGAKEKGFMMFEVDSSDLTDQEYKDVASYIQEPEYEVDGETILRKRRYRIMPAAFPLPIRNKINAVASDVEAKQTVSDPFNIVLDRTSSHTVASLLEHCRRTFTGDTGWQDPDFPVSRLQS